MVEAPSRDKKKIEIWGYEECQKFLQTARAHSEYIAFLLALTTGMRQSEILALSWENVDFDRNLLSINETLERGRNHIQHKVKSKNSGS